MKFFVIIALLTLVTPVIAQENNSVRPKQLMAIAVISTGTPQDFLAHELFAGRLAGRLKIRLVAVKISSDQVFEKLYEGESKVTVPLLLLARLKTILVGRMVYKFQPETTLSNSIVCTLTLSYRLLLNNGDIIFSDVIMSNENNVSEGKALEEAINKAVDQVITKLAEEKY